MSWEEQEGLGIGEKIGLTLQPPGEEGFEDNELKALGNKGKKSDSALESRPAGRIGMEDSGREIRRRPLTHYMVYKRLKFHEAMSSL